MSGSHTGLYTCQLAGVNGSNTFDNATLFVIEMERNITGRQLYVLVSNLKNKYVKIYTQHKSMYHTSIYLFITDRYNIICIILFVCL